jgi:ATP/maltotriose-dependent transcriptional regulator MalT
VQRALELEDRSAVTSMVTAPGMHNAMLLAFTGRLDEAHHAMREINDFCSTRGDESEQVFVAFHWGLLEIWRGEFGNAARIADDAMERARLLDGDLPRGAALTVRAALAAYAGRTDAARRDATRAVGAVAPAGSRLLSAWPVMVLGFLDVALGDYAAALTTLEPLLAAFDPEATEIFSAAHLPDAVEAYVALDRLTDAEPLVDALERNGRRLDRPWMSAVGARCRALLLAAQGDVDAASAHAAEAMHNHGRLQMPFERARTQLLVGQLQRRQRRKGDSADTLREAVQAFDSMGTTMWAERARAELARSEGPHTGTEELTPSERRVAELAAAGLSNRDIAGALFISPKTVETNLARVYRKLDIHSRVQLPRYVEPRDL